MYNKNMKRLSVATLVALSMVMVSCSGSGNKTKNANDSIPTAILVKTALTTEADVEQIAQFTGTIQPFLENNICPSMPVRIDQINVEVGDRVSKGQVLVRMDQTQFRQASVQLANLEIDYQRTKSVYDAGGISKQQLDQLFTQVEVARENVKNLKENIELRSPINGVVTGRYYDAGDMFSLSPKDGVVGVLTVMQISQLKVQVNVSEQYFPKVKIGMPVDIAVDIYPNEEFKGKVSLIYPAIDATTRTFTVEVTIPNGNNKLRPGMFSRVTLNLGKQLRVLLPDLALQKQIGSNEKYVFVVKGDVVNRTTVTVGRQIGQDYEVLTGLTAGEQVVTGGATKLMDQTKIEISQK